MIDWKKEYEKIYKAMLTMLILLGIAFIMLTVTVVVTTNEIDKKEEKITIQQIEIIDLKEQIHMLKTKEV